MNDLFPNPKLLIVQDGNYVAIENYRQFNFPSEKVGDIGIPEVHQLPVIWDNVDNSLPFSILDKSGFERQKGLIQTKLLVAAYGIAKNHNAQFYFPSTNVEGISLQDIKDSQFRVAYSMGIMDMLSLNRTTSMQKLVGFSHVDFVVGSGSVLLYYAK